MLPCKPLKKLTKDVLNHWGTIKGLTYYIKALPSKWALSESKDTKTETEIQRLTRANGQCTERERSRPCGTPGCAGGDREPFGGRRGLGPRSRSVGAAPSRSWQEAPRRWGAGTFTSATPAHAWNSESYNGLPRPPFPYSLRSAQAQLQWDCVHIRFCVKVWTCPFCRPPALAMHADSSSTRVSTRWRMPVVA